MSANNNQKKRLELNQEREEIFTRAIAEAEKLKKNKKGQDISCGKVASDNDDDEKKRFCADCRMEFDAVEMRRRKTKKGVIQWLCLRCASRCQD